MKTTIEINDYEVKIEEMEGVLMISVTKDGEVIEEIELGAEEDFEGQDEEEVQDFDEFEDDDDDDDEEFQDDDEDEDDEVQDFEDFEDDDDYDDEFSKNRKTTKGHSQMQVQKPSQVQGQKEAQLESFSSFIRKNK